MNKKDADNWFALHGKRPVDGDMSRVFRRESYTVEEMYQAFAARFRAENQIDMPLASHYGRIVGEE